MKTKKLFNYSTNKFEEDDDNDFNKINKITKFNKFSYILISLNFGLSSLADLSIQYYCKDVLKLEPSEFSRYFTLSQIPWVMKPLFGLLTDSFPIFGKRRKYYIIICGLIGIISWFMMAFFSYNFFNMILFLTLMNTGLSFSSVLGEAIVVELSQLKSDSEKRKLEKNKELKMINENEKEISQKIYKDGNIINDNENLEKINEKIKVHIDIRNTKTYNNLVEENLKNSQNYAKDYISLFFFFKYTGALISSIFKGYLIQIFSFSTIFIITGLLSNLTVLSGIIFVESDFKNKIKSNHNFLNQLNDQKYSILSHDFSYNGFETTSTNIKQNQIYENNPKVIDGEGKGIIPEDKSKLDEKLNQFENSSLIDQIKVIIEFMKQKFIYIPTILLIIFMSTPSYNDPIFYFFTEELKLNSVNLGIVSIFSIIFTLLAILIYKYKLKKYSFRAMIIGCSLVSFIFSFMTYILTKRINLIFGIPDMLIIIFSTSINSLLGELTLMPMLSLACLLSPKNLEGTAYSIFMSALNLGAGLSIFSGSYLTQYFGITAKDFSNLPKMIMVSNILSIIPIPLFLFFNNKYFSPGNPKNNKEEFANKDDSRNNIQ